MNHSTPPSRRPSAGHRPTSASRNSPPSYSRPQTYAGPSGSRSGRPADPSRRRPAPPANTRPMTREEAARRRAAAERKRAARRRKQMLHTLLAVLIGLLLLVILIVLFRSCIRTEPASAETDSRTQRPVEITDPPQTYEDHLQMLPLDTATPDHMKEKPILVRPTVSASAAALSTEIASEYAVLIDPVNHTILAQKNAETRMYPASMTKVMTLLVAYEILTDLDAVFTVTSTIIDPLYCADASLAGFSPNEEVTIRDLMYGTILPSGAEAAVSLAICAAGSEEEFVQLMNEKAQDLGLTNTHFTNCSGLHDPDHYSTAVEMAMILDYVLQYSQCREILSTYQYTTAPTNKHPEGVFMESTMLSRMYGDEPDGVTILAGKTGYTTQAGHCLCSYAEDDVTGKGYILVTAGAEGKFEPVFDAIAVYSDFTPDSP